MAMSVRMEEEKEKRPVRVKLEGRSRKRNTEGGRKNKVKGGRESWKGERERKDQ